MTENDRWPRMIESLLSAWRIDFFASREFSLSGFFALSELLIRLAENGGKERRKTPFDITENSRRLQMKRILVLLALAVFAISVPLAMAQEKPAGTMPGDKPAKQINCCVKGKCEQAKDAEACTKLGGKVVIDCKECK